MDNKPPNSVHPFSDKPEDAGLYYVSTLDKYFEKDREDALKSAIVKTPTPTPWILIPFAICVLLLVGVIVFTLLAK